MLENGYIRLHRSILQWEWYDDLHVFRLFTHLLLMANFKQTQWHGRTLLRGQLVTSAAKLAEQTGLSVKACRVALQKLNQTGEVASEGHSRYTLLTINHYNLYQSEGQAGGAPGASGGQAPGAPAASEGLQRKKETNAIKQEGEKAWCAPLLADAGLSEKLLLAAQDWLRYKHERREDYKPTGLRCLLSEVRQSAAAYGDEAVCAAIRRSMSNNWRGIVWDKLSADKEQGGAPAPQAPLADWEQEQVDMVKARLRQRRAQRESGI